MLYISEKVSTDKVMKLLKTLKELGTEPHQIALCKDEEILFEMAIPPYKPDDQRVVFSVSKSFTSTAVGMCYDRGLLKPEDKITKFFPEEITKNADERIKRLTVHNLLCMNSAIKDRMPAIEREYTNEPVKAYFSLPTEPETDIFHYDNTASFMLSAIVKQVTGMTVLDLLNKDFFPYLNLPSCKWITVGGISEGYAGLYTTARHIALTMQVYVNKGVFAGKRLLSEEWVRMATSPQISTKDDNKFVWWTQGYGYQFWMSIHEGCRAEGACGQTGFIFPSLHTSLGHEGLIDKMDETHDAYYEFCSDFSGESVTPIGEVEEFIDNWFKPLNTNDSTFDAIGNTYQLDDPNANLNLVRLSETDDEIVCEVSNGFEWQSIRLGKNKWCRNELIFIDPTAGRVVCNVPTYKSMKFAACCEKKDGNTLNVSVRFTDEPLNYDIVLTLDNDKLTFKSDLVSFSRAISEYTATKI